MHMHHIRRGTGKPLLLIHGIGSSWRSWRRIIYPLADAGREVIAIDLPGHGDTPKLKGEVSIRTLADAVTEFLKSENLLGVDAVGSSMGARLVLELARRGNVLGSVISLDPGGFWQGWEIPFFYYSVAGSIRVVRSLQPVLPALTWNPLSRAALLAQFSARPWNVPSAFALGELNCMATSPSADELLNNLAWGEPQKGAPMESLQSPLVIGWGRQDLVCLPRQAERAMAAFPDAHLHWFANCGHFPQWDRPKETVRLILAATAGKPLPTMPSQERTHPVPMKTWAAMLGVGFAMAASTVWMLRRRGTGTLRA